MNRDDTPRRRQPTGPVLRTLVQSTLALTALVLTALVLATRVVAAPAPSTADAVAECDRRAAHPEDPNRVGPGVERKDIDLPVATAACERAIAAAPTNARVRYQYARLLFYADRNAAAVEEMKRAADAGHPQAQFVFGTFVARGRPGAPTDLCVAEDYWRKSAAGGRQAARVQYLRYTLQGRFDGCRARLPDAGLRAMLDVATKTARDFYERIVIEDLTAALDARTRSGAK